MHFRISNWNISTKTYTALSTDYMNKRNSHGNFTDIKCSCLLTYLKVALHKRFVTKQGKNKTKMSMSLTNSIGIGHAAQKQRHVSWTTCSVKLPTQSAARLTVQVPCASKLQARSVTQCLMKWTVYSGAGLCRQALLTAQTKHYFQCSANECVP